MVVYVTEERAVSDIENKVVQIRMCVWWCKESIGVVRVRVRVREEA